MFQAGVRTQPHFQISAQALAEIALAHKRGMDGEVFLSGFLGDTWKQCFDAPSALAAFVTDAPQPQGAPPRPLLPSSPLASEPLTVALPSGRLAGGELLGGGFAAGEPATVQLAAYAPQANPYDTATATFDEPSATTEETESTATSQVVTADNGGSLGHPFCCSRPCMFFASGTCANSAGCSYCHLPHPKRPVHLDKQSRALFDSMHLSCRVGLLLSLLRKKVTSAGLMDRVEPSLDGLASACGACLASEILPDCRATCKKSDRALRSALSGMAIRPLLTMLERTVGVRYTDAANAIETFWNQCRSGFKEGCSPS